MQVRFGPHQAEKDVRNAPVSVIRCRITLRHSCQGRAGKSRRRCTSIIARSSGSGCFGQAHDVKSSPEKLICSCFTLRPKLTGMAGSNATEGRVASPNQLKTILSVRVSRHWGMWRPVLEAWPKSIP